MTKRILSKGIRRPQPLATVEEEDLMTPNTSSGEDEHASSSPSTRSTTATKSPDPPIPEKEISLSSSFPHSDEEQTSTLSSTLSSTRSSTLSPGTPPPPIITKHNFADKPAPQVHLYRYTCRICNIHIYMPELVAGHLAQHKHPETNNWTCTSCGKQYLKGRWGYGMLLMHMQGRGDNKCGGLVDLRAQYAHSLGVEGSLSTVEAVDKDKTCQCAGTKAPAE